MYTIKAKSTDSNRYFSDDHRSGILIQHKFKRAIYFVNNLNIDEFCFEENTTTNEVEAWIETKRKHYEDSTLGNEEIIRQ